MRFGIFLYPGVEPIDLATFGVLSVARRVAPEIEIITIAPEAGEVRLANGLRVIADVAMADAPTCHLVIVTGGPGWVEQARSAPTLAYLQRAASTGKLASVCTGGMILAASGLLDGRMATTKRRVRPPEPSPLAAMAKAHPVEAVEALLVDDGQIVTGGGVSLCIDVTLYLIGRELGDSTAEAVAHLIEYDRARAANLTGFPPRFGLPSGRGAA